MPARHWDRHLSNNRPTSGAGAF